MTALEINSPKNFMAFFGNNYYPSGGMCDHEDNFHTLEEAIDYLVEKAKSTGLSADGESPWHYQWAHVWDSTKHVIVWRSGDKRDYDVWLEGYQVTGQANKASFRGTYTATSFNEAIEAHIKTLPDDQASYYNPKNRTYWACRFFDNEADARKSFG